MQWVSRKGLGPVWNIIGSLLASHPDITSDILLPLVGVKKPVSTGHCQVRYGVFYHLQRCHNLEHLRFFWILDFCFPNCTCLRRHDCSRNLSASCSTRPVPALPQPSWGGYLKESWSRGGGGGGSQARVRTESPGQEMGGSRRSNFSNVRLSNPSRLLRTAHGVLTAIACPSLCLSWSVV